MIAWTIRGGRGSRAFFLAAWIGLAGFLLLAGSACHADGGLAGAGSAGRNIGAGGGESDADGVRGSAPGDTTAAIDSAADLPPVDAVLRFGDAEGAVTGRERLGMPDRYGEIARLENGYLRYQRLYTGSFAPEHDSAAAAALAYQDDWFQEQRFARPPEWRLTPTPVGPVTWTAVNSPDWRCVLFGRIWGDSRIVGSRGDRELRGLNCRRLDDPRLGALEAETLNLLQRLRAAG